MSNTLDRSIYRYIFRNAGIGQVILVCVAAASLPITYLALEVPKQIINTGIEGEHLPETVLGFEVTQVQYLLVLCFVFLGLVFVNGAMKYVVNVLKGLVAERLLSQLRHELFRRVLRFPLSRFKHLSQGEIIAMATAETEPIGTFFGDSAAEPALQGGVLLTYLVFIFNQDPFLGAAAIALYPVQMYVVPQLQKRVNQLGRQRVRTVREMANRIGENVSGVADVHANGTARFEISDIGQRLSRVFEIRYDIYKRKYLIKFLNNFLAAVTPFFFYSVGGYFVIVGELSMGALVAVLAAYKDLNPPWKALLKHYQIKEDARIKYEQVVEQFDVADMRDPELLTATDGALRLDGPVQVSHVSLLDDNSDKLLDDLSLTVQPGEKVALTGPGGGGKSELAQLLARIESPSSGHIRIGEHDFERLPEPVLGRRLGFVGQQPYLFAGTIFDNLAYALKQAPLVGGHESGGHKRAGRIFGPPEGLAEGLESNWIDYELAGVDDEDGLRRRMLEIARAVGLGSTLYELGLQGRLDTGRASGYAERLVEARRALRRQLEERQLSDLIEPYDEERYNNNATVAENLLFGTPLDATYAAENLARNEHVGRVLREVGVYERMLDVGRRAASTMVELFADLPPEHEFFEQFGLIGPNDLPTYRQLLARVDKQAPGEISAEDRQHLLELAFKLVPERHRLGLLDDETKSKLVEARKLFAAKLPAADRDKIAFFQSDTYNPAAPVLDNVLLGKVVYGAANARERVRALVQEVLDSLDMREVVLGAGLEYDVGVGGGRLTGPQRKKLAVARSLLKRPDVLVLDEVDSGLSAEDQNDLAEAVVGDAPGSTVLWALAGEQLESRFTRSIRIDGGRVASAADAAAPDSESPATAASETPPTQGEDPR